MSIGDENFRTTFSRTPRKMTKETTVSHFRSRTHSIASATSSSDSSTRQAPTSLYKTELCRSYEESGTCRYGKKCQFAHSRKEVRVLNRHPKYKTEMCKSFHSTGYCPYGTRCHFVHIANDDSHDRLDDESPTTTDPDHCPRPISFGDSSGEFEEIETLKTLGSLSLGVDEWSTSCLSSVPAARSLSSVGSSDSVWSNPKPNLPNQNIHQMAPQSVDYNGFSNGFSNPIQQSRPDFIATSPDHFHRPYNVENEILTMNSPEQWNSFAFSPGRINRHGVGSIGSTGVSSGSDRDSLAASPDNDHHQKVPNHGVMYKHHQTDYGYTPSFKTSYEAASIAFTKADRSSVLEESRLPVFRSLSISEQ